MEILKPRYNATEFAQRGRVLYQEKIKSKVIDKDIGKFVAIDIETGDYEIDHDDYKATQRLLERQPEAQIWLVRVGERTTYRIGGYHSRNRT